MADRSGAMLWAGQRKYCKAMLHDPNAAVCWGCFRVWQPWPHRSAKAFSTGTCSQERSQPGRGRSQRQAAKELRYSRAWLPKDSQSVSKIPRIPAMLSLSSGPREIEKHWNSAGEGQRQITRGRAGVAPTFLASVNLHAPVSTFLTSL